MASNLDDYDSSVDSDWDERVADANAKEDYDDEDYAVMDVRMPNSQDAYPAVLITDDYTKKSSAAAKLGFVYNGIAYMSGSSGTSKDINLLNALAFNPDASLAGIQANDFTNPFNKTPRGDAGFDTVSWFAGEPVKSQATLYFIKPESRKDGFDFNAPRPAKLIRTHPLLKLNESCAETITVAYQSFKIDNGSVGVPPSKMSASANAETFPQRWFFSSRSGYNLIDFGYRGGALKFSTIVTWLRDSPYLFVNPSADPSGSLASIPFPKDSYLKRLWVYGLKTEFTEEEDMEKVFDVKKAVLEAKALGYNDSMTDAMYRNDEHFASTFRLKFVVAWNKDIERLGRDFRHMMVNGYMYRPTTGRAESTVVIVSNIRGFLGPTPPQIENYTERLIRVKSSRIEDVRKWVKGTLGEVRWENMTGEEQSALLARLQSVQKTMFTVNDTATHPAYAESILSTSIDALAKLSFKGLIEKLGIDPKLIASNSLGPEAQESISVWISEVINNKTRKIRDQDPSEDNAVSIDSMSGTVRSYSSLPPKRQALYNQTATSYTFPRGGDNPHEGQKIYAQISHEEIYLEAISNATKILDYILTSFFIRFANNVISYETARSHGFDDRKAFQEFIGGDGFFDSIYSALFQGPAIANLLAMMYADHHYYGSTPQWFREHTFPEQAEIYVQVVREIVRKDASDYSLAFFDEVQGARLRKSWEKLTETRFEDPTSLAGIMKIAKKFLEEPAVRNRYLIRIPDGWIRSDGTGAGKFTKGSASVKNMQQTLNTIVQDVLRDADQNLADGVSRLLTSGAASANDRMLLTAATKAIATGDVQDVKLTPTALAVISNDVPSLKSLELDEHFSDPKQTASIDSKDLAAIVEKFTLGIVGDLRASAGDKAKRTNPVATLSAGKSWSKAAENYTTKVMAHPTDEVAVAQSHTTAAATTDASEVCAAVPSIDFVAADDSDNTTYVGTKIRRPKGDFYIGGRKIDVSNKSHFDELVKVAIDHLGLGADVMDTSVRVDVYGVTTSTSSELALCDQDMDVEEETDNVINAIDYSVFKNKKKKSTGGSVKLKARAAVVSYPDFLHDDEGIATVSAYENIDRRRERVLAIIVRLVSQRKAASGSALDDKELLLDDEANDSIDVNVGSQIETERHDARDRITFLDENKNRPSESEYLQRIRMTLVETIYVPFLSAHADHETRIAIEKLVLQQLKQYNIIPRFDSPAFSLSELYKRADYMRFRENWSGKKLVANNTFDFMIPRWKAGGADNPEWAMYTVVYDVNWDQPKEDAKFGTDRHKLFWLEELLKFQDDEEPSTFDVRSFTDRDMAEPYVIQMREEILTAKRLYMETIAQCNYTINDRVLLQTLRSESFARVPGHYYNPNDYDPDVFLIDFIGGPHDGPARLARVLIQLLLSDEMHCGWNIRDLVVAVSRVAASGIGKPSYLSKETQTQLSQTNFANIATTKFPFAAKYLLAFLMKENVQEYMYNALVLGENAEQFAEVPISVMGSAGKTLKRRVRDVAFKLDVILGTYANATSIANLRTREKEKDVSSTSQFASLTVPSFFTATSILRDIAAQESEIEKGMFGLIASAARQRDASSLLQKYNNNRLDLALNADDTTVFTKRMSEALEMFVDSREVIPAKFGLITVYGVSSKFYEHKDYLPYADDTEYIELWDDTHVPVYDINMDASKALRSNGIYGGSLLKRPSPVGTSDSVQLANYERIYGDGVVENVDASQEFSPAVSVLPILAKLEKSFPESKPKDIKKEERLKESLKKAVEKATRAEQALEKRLDKTVRTKFGDNRAILTILFAGYKKTGPTSDYDLISVPYAKNIIDSELIKELPSPGQAFFSLPKSYQEALRRFNRYPGGILPRAYRAGSSSAQFVFKESNYNGLFKDSLSVLYKDLAKDANAHVLMFGNDLRLADRVHENIVGPVVKARKIWRMAKQSYGPSSKSFNSSKINKALVEVNRIVRNVNDLCKELRDQKNKDIATFVSWLHGGEYDEKQLRGKSAAARTKSLLSLPTVRTISMYPSYKDWPYKENVMRPLKPIEAKSDTGTVITYAPIPIEFKGLEGPIMLIAPDVLADVYDFEKSPLENVSSGDFDTRLKQSEGNDVLDLVDLFLAVFRTEKIVSAVEKMQRETDRYKEEKARRQAANARSSGFRAVQYGSAQEEPVPPPRVPATPSPAPKKRPRSPSDSTEERTRKAILLMEQANRVDLDQPAGSSGSPSRVISAIRDPSEMDTEPTAMNLRVALRNAHFIDNVAVHLSPEFMRCLHPSNVCIAAAGKSFGANAFKTMARVEDVSLGISPADLKYVHRALDTVSSDPLLRAAMPSAVLQSRTRLFKSSLLAAALRAGGHVIGTRVSVPSYLQALTSSADILAATKHIAAAVQHTDRRKAYDALLEEIGEKEKIAKKKESQLLVPEDKVSALVSKIRNYSSQNGTIPEERKADMITVVEGLDAMQKEYVHLLEARSTYDKSLEDENLAKEAIRNLYMAIVEISDAKQGAEEQNASDLGKLANSLTQNNGLFKLHLKETVGFNGFWLTYRHLVKNFLDIRADYTKIFENPIVREQGEFDKYDKFTQNRDFYPVTHFVNDITIRARKAIEYRPLDAITLP